MQKIITHTLSRIRGKIPEEKLKKHLVQLRRAAAYGGCLLVSFLMPCASVFGNMAMFGLSFFAAMSQTAYALVSLFGVLLGYVYAGLGLGIRYPKYLSALLIFVVLQQVVKKKLPRLDESKRDMLLCLVSLAAGSLLWTRFSRWNGKSVLLSVCELFLCLAACYFFTRGYRAFLCWKKEYLLSVQETISLGLLCLIPIVALTHFEVAGLCVGRIAGVLFILFVAHRKGCAAGCIVGLVSGFAMSMGMPDMLAMSVVYALGALGAGLAARINTVVMASVYITLTTFFILYLNTSLQGIISIYEAVAGSALFLLVPKSFGAHKNGDTAHTQSGFSHDESIRRYTVGKIDAAAKALDEVADTIAKASETLGMRQTEESLYSLLEKSAAEVCAGCKKRYHCVHSHFSQLRDVLNNLVPILAGRPQLEQGDIPPWFSEQCAGTLSMVRAINTRLAAREKQRQQNGALAEKKEFVLRQYRQLAAALEKISEDIPDQQDFDRYSEEKFAQIVRESGINAKGCVCYTGKQGQLRYEMRVPAATEQAHLAAVGSRLGKWAGQNLGLRTEKEDGELIACYYTLASVRIEADAARCQKEGEKHCGDSYESFEMEENRQFFLLSDGMGSGGMAAVNSAMCTSMMKKLLSAGIELSECIHIVNSALMLKGGEESFATLDLLEIDAGAQSAQFIKLGACASFIKRGARIIKIKSDSLPIGILEEIVISKARVRLQEGDVIVLVSDGVSGENEHWLEKLLSHTPAEKIKAKYLIDQACLNQAHHKDDMSAVVIHVGGMAEESPRFV